MANPKVKIVKKALANKYGYKNVSVKNGQGTAWGWVKAKVYLPNTNEPKECNCDYSKGYTCPQHKHLNEMKDKIHTEAVNIAYKAMAKSDEKFYQYSVDDGYSTEADEFILTIEAKTE